MNRRDPAALVLGLVFLLIASVGLRSTLGGADWAGQGVVLPVALIVIGALGLHQSRH